MTDYARQVSCALVLAAGQGTRLGNHTPKPLFQLLGLPLLARTLFTLEQAGITDAYVVLGYEAERVRQAIEGIDRLRIRVHWLQNDRWERPNGVSVLAAESVLTEPFILTMCDHVLDPDVINILRSSVRELRGIDLAIDRKLESIFDLEDATKVRVVGGRIVEIGKGLPVYNAVDSGAFLATPALFDAVREACSEGKETLSHGVQKLADWGMARVTDIGDRQWQDVDTPLDAREAERKLLATVRKASDGPIARYLNRPISMAVSRLLLKTSVTPNQVTFANLLLGLIAAGLAAIGGYVAFLAAGIVFQLTSVLDGTDGEMAKLTFQASKRGEWLDTISDNITYLAFLLGLIVGVHRSHLPEFYYLSGVLGLAVAFVVFVNLHFYLARQKKSGSFLSVRYGFETGRGRWNRLMRVLQYLGKRDMMAFLVIMLAIVGQMPVVLPSFGIGATLGLLPWSLKANLSSYLRRPRRERTVVPTPVPAPAWVVRRQYWFTDDRSERVSETAPG